MSIWIRKVSEDPLTFEDDPSEKTSIIAMFMVFATVHLGMGFWGLSDLLLSGQNTLNLFAFLFGNIFGSVFALFAILGAFLAPVQVRFVIRDGAVQCYRKQKRSTSWTLAESLPASVFDEVERSSWWGGEGDWGKSITLKGPSQTVTFYSDRGIGREENSFWSGDEIKMTEQISRKLGNLRITTRGIETSEYSIPVIICGTLAGILILADVAFLFYFLAVIFD